MKLNETEQLGKCLRCCCYRRSNEVAGWAGWLGVVAAVGAEEAWAGTDGEV